MAMIDLSILTNDHPRFEEFIEDLEAYCHFHTNEEGVMEWTCQCTHDADIKILEQYEGIDVEKTIAYFEENGGYCDCEVIFNIQPKKGK